MKELLVISGKGGTGKTSLVGAFAVLAENKVLADCDVDAANLHLLLEPEVKQKNKFIGSKLPVIDETKCIKCGKCEQNCRFDAIVDFEVKEYLCESCLLCYNICPQNAVKLKDRISGHWFVSETNYGPFVHAKLGIAEENSGKLVAEVRKNAKLIAEKNDAELIITDGPPGTGCPVISSLSGVDLALIVTEPTVAGLHDLERIANVAQHFEIKTAVCINKYDLDKEKVNELEKYCKERNMPVVGKISYSKLVTDSMIKGNSVVESYKDSTVSKQIIKIWENVLELLTSD